MSREKSKGDFSISGTKPFSFHTLNAGEQRKRIETEYVSLNHIDMEHGLKQGEYETAKKLRPHNRYSDVLGNEPTLWPGDKTKESRYINANKIHHQIKDVPHELVAGQAPLTEYFGDFWYNMVSHKIHLVMMLTDVFEKGYPKADQYWPSEVGETDTFKGGKVTLVDETKLKEEHITLRELEIEHEELGKHSLKQIQYTGWPDHGVPQQTGAFNHLVRYMFEAPTDAPIFIHCSAGIGRTGTLMAVYLANVLIERDDLHDESVPHIVSRLKSSRTGSVQRPEQYLYIYRSVEHCLKEKNGAKAEGNNTDGK